MGISLAKFRGLGLPCSIHVTLAHLVIQSSALTKTNIFQYPQSQFGCIVTDIYTIDWKRDFSLQTKLMTPINYRLSAKELDTLMKQKPWITSKPLCNEFDFAERRSLCLFACLSVCLSVCLLATL